MTTAKRGKENSNSGNAIDSEKIGKPAPETTKPKGAPNPVKKAKPTSAGVSWVSLLPLGSTNRPEEVSPRTDSVEGREIGSTRKHCPRRVNSCGGDYPRLFNGLALSGQFGFCKGTRAFKWFRWIDFRSDASELPAIARRRLFFCISFLKARTTKFIPSRELFRSR